MNPNDSLGTFKIDGETFEVLQVHLHGPAEHLFESIRRPVELHIVHKNINNPKDFAVLGLTFSESPSPNRWLDFLLTGREFPNKANSSFAILSDEQRYPELSMLIPAQTSLWHYEGSLTTPGCDELVRWFLIPQALPASHAQLAMLADTLLFNGTNGNFRGIQSNGRLIDAVQVNAKSTDPAAVSFNYLHQGLDWVVGACTSGVAQSPIHIHPYMAEYVSDILEVDWKILTAPTTMKLDRKRMSLTLTLEDPEDVGMNRRVLASDEDLDILKARVSESRLHPDDLDKKGFDFKVQHFSKLNSEHADEITNLNDKINLKRRRLNKSVKIGTVSWRGESYSADTLHFHAPSEHVWHGERRPLEMHVIHNHLERKSAIVLSISFVEDPNNVEDPFLNEVLMNGLPGDGYVDSHVLTKFNISSAIPDIREDHLTPDYTVWNYPGSLTTPDCGEFVSWMVFDVPRSASREQLEAFAAMSYPGSLGDFRMALEPSPSQKLLGITSVRVNGELFSGDDHGLSSGRVVSCPANVPAANVKKLSAANRAVSATISLHFSEMANAVLHPSGQIVLLSDTDDDISGTLDYRCIDEHHSFASIYRDQTDSCEFARRMSLNTPSSHFIDGQQYPLELLIHYDDTTLSIPYVASKDDKPSPFLNEILQFVNADVSSSGFQHALNTSLLTRGIGNSLRVLHVQPQCTANNSNQRSLNVNSIVRKTVYATPWLILEQPIGASREQLRLLTKILNSSPFGRHAQVVKSRGSRKLQSTIPLLPSVVVINPTADVPFDKADISNDASDFEGDSIVSTQMDNLKTTVNIQENQDNFNPEASESTSPSNSISEVEVKIGNSGKSFGTSFSIGVSVGIFLVLTLIDLLSEKSII